MEIELGCWYKHLHSPAYGIITRIYKHNVRVVYDNGFHQLVNKDAFFEHFATTPRSEKMNSANRNRHTSTP